MATYENASRFGRPPHSTDVKTYVVDGTTLIQLLLTPPASATVSSINYHKLFGFGDITGTTAFGFGAPTKPTTGIMASFGRTAIATATLTDTGLDIRALNRLVNTGANTLQGAYIKAKNYSTGTVGGDLIGLFIETVQDGTCSGSSYGLKIGSDGSTLTSDIILRNGATIDNGAAGTLTLTETAIALAGTVDSSGDFTVATNKLAVAAATGVITLANGATIDNNASATVLNLTETTVRATGAFNVTGITTFGSAAHDGLLHGAGTSSAKATTAVADKHFLSYYLENTATSGDNRGMYLRLYLNGTGGGGESLRAFTTIQKACGTAHGAHISLNFGTSPANLSGLGVANRCTLHVPNRAMDAGGTYAAVQAEAYLDGTSSDISTVTKHSLIRAIVDGGDATSRAKFKNLMEVVAEAADKATQYMVCNADVTGAGGASTYGLQVCVNGTQYWLALYAIA